MATPQDQKITFNLDTVEREKEPVEPFVVAIGDRAITLIDPQDLDYQTLLAIEQPVQFLRHAMSKEDREFLRTQKIPGWKFGEMMNRYMRHYGLDELPNGGGSRTL